MNRFYSKSTGCTYLTSIHSVIPDDAVEIPEALYQSVIANPTAGKVRAHDEQGLPYLVDAPAVVADLAGLEREWRDTELSTVMWLRERHRDQLEIEVEPTLSGEQFTELLIYMQALRDWPQSPDFPQSAHRPVAPPWIAEQTQ
ncbi:phage tail assembly chaperone [Pseudomonas sp. MAFF 302030]|uniref:Phage tail assembly chaperone n=1 Tax=Pseudomonas morbosilactucae TaxID=2938197 RepID=A0A9X1Z5B8_9PSED|nr:phage tail assembly chaperone [Pseudomonas morbosilactucae]MCK9802454.1 phage tail assembly chaperone [Pseudomonas morbosilactucae]